MNNARHQYSATVLLHRVKNGTGGLHVAHVHTGLVGSGGDRVSELEARHLASRGHRVTMIGPTALDIAVRLAEHRIGIVGDSVETRSAQTVLAFSRSVLVQQTRRCDLAPNENMRNNDARQKPRQAMYAG
jgi:hypothetical protein